MEARILWTGFPLVYRIGFILICLALKAQQRFLSRYHDLWLEPHLWALFGQLDPTGRHEQETTYRLDKYQAQLEKLEELIANPYMVTREISMADIACPATLTLADILFPTFGRTQTCRPKLTARRRTRYSHPVVRAITDESGNAMRESITSGAG